MSVRLVRRPGNNKFRVCLLYIKCCFDIKIQSEMLILIAAKIQQFKSIIDVVKL